MGIFNGSEIRCETTNCIDYVKDNVFAKIRAHEAGWLFLRDGRAFCPEHTPLWLTRWRVKQPKMFHAYCPRCDRQFASKASIEEATEMVDEHVALAHKDYVELMEE